MEINAETRIADLLRTYPFLLDSLAAISPKFKSLANPLIRRTLGRFATLGQAAAIGGMEPAELIRAVERAIEAGTGGGAGEAVAGGGTGRDRIETLKEIIRSLHRGIDLETARARFAALVHDVDAAEVAQMEQALIAEGMPAEEVRRLCDVHVEVFREALERGEMPGVAPGHPVHTFMRENRAAEAILARLEGLLPALESEGLPAAAEGLRSGLEDLSQIERHFLRKENQLFPRLEAGGVSGPTQVMWAIHDDIRGMIKKAREALAAGDPGPLPEALRALIQAERDMIYKEEHILFPMALEVLSAEEWRRVRTGEEEIGYAWVRPAADWPPSRPAEPEVKTAGREELSLSTGRLTPEVLDLLLTHLPVDISFIDKDDRVAYYSQTKERIFPRSPAVIGRRVQNCHPPKSVPAVEKILQAFKTGAKDVAEFHIQLGGRFIHIRYFAVRSREGDYRGTLEVTQDVTAIRELQGEKRLLDWE